MILNDVKEEAILFLFSQTPIGSQINGDTYSSLVMKFNYRDLYNAINFEIEPDNAYVITDNQSDKKIILGLQRKGVILFCYDLIEHIKRVGIKSILMPIPVEDYFEDSVDSINELKKSLEDIKKMLTTLTKHDNIELEIKIIQLDRVEEEVEE